MAHRRISHKILWTLSEQHNPEGGFAAMVKFCDHIAALVWHRLIFFSGSYVKNYFYVDKFET
jgi:hypothetical protein